MLSAGRGLGRRSQRRVSRNRSEFAPQRGSSDLIQLSRGLGIRGRPGGATVLFAGPGITAAAREACRAQREMTAPLLATHFLDVASLWAFVISRGRRRSRPQTMDAPSPDQWAAGPVSRSHWGQARLPVGAFKIKPAPQDSSIIGLQVEKTKSFSLTNK